MGNLFLIKVCCCAKRNGTYICKRFVFLSLVFRLSYAEMDVKL